ncbi:MAG: hypothetical protein IH586_18695, partial [Anaerolineaceae bacterium]|nr:hypothetical protein [Anaerolineaceae bacterium]
GVNPLPFSPYCPTVPPWLGWARQPSRRAALALAAAFIFRHPVAECLLPSDAEWIALGGAERVPIGEAGQAQEELEFFFEVPAR